MSIGKRIKELRSHTKLSQKDLAERLGVSRGNVGDWESEKAKPGADALLTLSHYFKVTADWILSGNEAYSARISEQVSGSDFSPSDIELLSKFHQLSERDQLKIEGMIEGILLVSKDPHQSQSNHKSTQSKNTNEGDHAAASETA